MKPMDHNLQQEPVEVGNDARRKSLLENLYACPKCSKSFASGRALGGHLASHQRHDKMVEKEAAAAAAAVARGAEMGHISRLLAGRVLQPEQAPQSPPPLPPRVPTLYNFMNLHPSLLYGNGEATPPPPPSSGKKLPAWMDSSNPAANGDYANYKNNSSASSGSSRNFHGAHSSYYPYARETRGEFAPAALFAASNGVLLRTVDLLSQLDVPLPAVIKGGDDEEEGTLDLTLRL